MSKTNELYQNPEEKMKATNVRWRVFIIMLLLGAINYIDRTSLSIAMPYITEEFEITDTRVVGLVHSAFFWAYALMQIPSGVLADKFKTRNIIAIATIVWGAFQAVAALCHGIYTLSLSRLGLGVSEAPIMPAGAKLMGTWLTPTERGRGSMLLDGGAPLGTAFGAVIIAGLIAFFGSWRMAFVVAGVGTILAGILAWWYIRTYPAEHPKINKAELAHIEKYNADAQKPSKKYKLSDIKPYLKQRNVLHTMLAISAITAGVGIFLCAQSKSPTMAIILLTIALFPLRWASVYWSIPSLLGAQKVAGTICGTMNFTSNLFAAILPIVIGFIVQATGKYFAAMMFFAASAVGYLICSLLINFDKPMEIHEE